MSLLIDAGLAGELLGRHVLRRAGERRVVVVAARGRDAEVGDADVAVAVDHHVGRLQIAVQHAALVRRGDAGAQLARDLDRLVLRDAADAAEQRREILAVDVLHREEAAAVGVAEVVEPARRSCARPGARCAARCGTARAALSSAADAFGQELQRDRLIEREIVGAVHFAHAAAAEQRDQAVAAGDDGARAQAGSVTRAPAGVWSCRARPWRVAPNRRIDVGHPEDSTGGAGLTRLRIS